MTLRDYVVKNYQRVFVEEPSEALKQTLFNLFARHIDINEFKREFNLDCYEDVFAFVVDPNNAFDICKLGYRNYELKEFHYADKPSASEDDYDYGEGAFVKKFR